MTLILQILTMLAAFAAFLMLGTIASHLEKIAKELHEMNIYHLHPEVIAAAIERRIRHGRQNPN